MGKKIECSVSGYQNSHFFVEEGGITTTTLAQMERFTKGDVTEIIAPVWQLCDSRHENPVANLGGIFPKCVVNPMDTRRMKKEAIEKIKPYYGFGDTLFCVVTGMSSALIALVNACTTLDVKLCLLHYNVVYECYQMQPVDNYFLDNKLRLAGIRR